VKRQVIALLLVVDDGLHGEFAVNEVDFCHAVT